MDEIKAAFVEVVGLAVVKHGIPFVIEMFKVWGSDKEITLDDIEALGEQIKQDEPFLKE